MRRETRKAGQRSGNVREPRRKAWVSTVDGGPGVVLPHQQERKGAQRAGGQEAERHPSVTWWERNGGRVGENGGREEGTKQKFQDHSVHMDNVIMRKKNNVKGNIINYCHS